MPVAGRWWDLATLLPFGNSPGAAGALRLARRSARLPVRIGPAQRLDTPAHRRLGMLWKARSFPERAAFAPHCPAPPRAALPFALGPSARHEPDRETSTAPSARPSRGAMPAPGAPPRYGAVPIPANGGSRDRPTGPPRLSFHIAACAPRDKGRVQRGGSASRRPSDARPTRRSLHYRCPAGIGISRIFARAAGSVGSSTSPAGKPLDCSR